MTIHPGQVVKFRTEGDPGDTAERFRVLEVNGDRGIMQLLGWRGQIAPTSLFLVADVEPVGPADLGRMTRDECIQWLAWNDPNGTYSDADAIAEGLAPLTESQARELVRKQLSDH